MVSDLLFPHRVQIERFNILQIESLTKGHGARGESVIDIAHGARDLCIAVKEPSPRLKPEDKVRLLP